MERKTVKRLALFSMLAMLVIGSLHVIVLDLEARGRGGRRSGGRRGGSRRGGGRRGGSRRGGRGHHRGGRHHGNRGRHGGRGYYGGGGYWSDGAWVPAAVAGAAITGAAIASAGQGAAVVEDDNGDYDSYPTCGRDQYFNEASGECEFVNQESQPVDNQERY